MDQGVRARIAEGLAEQVFAHLIDEAELEVAGCESPIESIFLAALLAYWRLLDACPDFDCDELTYCSQGNVTHLIRPANSTSMLGELVAHRHKHHTIKYRFCQNSYVLVQPSIGQYRADFVILRLCETACEGSTPHLYVGPLVVECDGAAYHDSTAEQLRRDRGRDREFQIAGYHVMRFTGSELYRDPVGCVLQVERWLAEREAANCDEFKRAMDLTKRDDTELS